MCKKVCVTGLVKIYFAMKNLRYFTTPTNRATEKYSYNIYEFDLDSLNDDECLSEFRFRKKNIYELPRILGLPDEITCYNRMKID